MAERADDELNRRDFLRLGGAAVAAGAAGLCPGSRAAAVQVPSGLNVYEAAALSAVVELCIQSNAKRARTLDVPDFTRGRWRTNPKLGIVPV